MGTIYRQAGRKIWMIKYYRDGRPVVETSGTEDKRKAKALVRQREADGDRGGPRSTRATRQFRFEDAATDIENEYRANKRKSLADLQRRIRLHLTPFFGGQRMTDISTTDVRTFIGQRLDAKAANAEINRELAALKRMYTLAVQAEKLSHRPYIPMLREDNVRTGFFEWEAFDSLRRHLPEAYRPVVTFAYLTGWRIQSEVLALEWNQVDFTAGTVRLHQGTTKNDAGRLFPFDILPELQQLLQDQRAVTDALERREHRICPWVFHDQGRKLLDQSGWAIRDFRTAWTAAAKAAGCPHRIPHDFRRTAVRNLVRAGVPEKTAMLLTGHKTRSVFDRYDIVNEADLRQAVGKLASTLAQPTASSNKKRGRPRLVAVPDARRKSR